MVIVFTANCLNLLYSFISFIVGIAYKIIKTAHCESKNWAKDIELLCFCFSVLARFSNRTAEGKEVRSHKQSTWLIIWLVSNVDFMLYSICDLESNSELQWNKIWKCVGFHFRQKKNIFRAFESHKSRQILANFDRQSCTSTVAA